MINITLSKKFENPFHKYGNLETSVYFTSEENETFEQLLERTKKGLIMATKAIIASEQERINEAKQANNLEWQEVKTQAY